jgi:16S rRNA (guanine527-N7)-methyltransferase
VQFTLIDSTGKKIKVVDSIVNDLGLRNVEAIHTRAENYNGRFNYVVSRAVCSFPGLVELSSAKLLKDRFTLPHHGIYSLKGGDIQDEVAAWKEKVKIFQIGSFFNEEFFKTKCIVFLSTGAVLPG